MEPCFKRGWFCSRSHLDTDGKSKYFPVTWPPGVGSEGKRRRAPEGASLVLGIDWENLLKKERKRAERAQVSGHPE